MGHPMKHRHDRSQADRPFPFQIPRTWAKPCASYTEAGERCDSLAIERRDYCARHMPAPRGPDGKLL